VVYPSYADDAAGLLRTSIRSRGVTLFLEPKALYNAPKVATPIPDDFEVPFGKAKVRREGTDVSIITYGNTTPMCMDIAEKMAEKDISVEVVDLRSLSPLDSDAILASAKKTGKVLVVHEDKVFGGFGGEVVSQITESAFEYLDGPVMRVGSTFTPVGFNRILEKAILPDMERIQTALDKLLKY
jgi:2-oxoisovalerate dehydrogenase E1 component